METLSKGLQSVGGNTGGGIDRAQLSKDLKKRSPSEKAENRQDADPKQKQRLI